MLLINSFSYYKIVVFLSSKLTDTILKVFKTYLVVVKQQTEKKLRRIHMNIGRE